MNTQHYIKLLQNPMHISNNNAEEIKLILEEFPYLQSARALYLKYLKSKNDHTYEKELSITAAYTKNRNVLFNFILYDNFTINSTDIKETIPEIDNIFDEKITESITVGKNEFHTFEDWIHLISSNKTVLKESKIIKKDKKSDIIDMFLATNPKIKHITNKYTTIPDENDYDDLMTETLAKIYLEQKKYDNAIKAYKILSLKYPKKSSFFEEQIKAIIFLQKNI